MFDAVHAGGEQRWKSRNQRGRQPAYVSNIAAYPSPSGLVSFEVDKGFIANQTWLISPEDLSVNYRPTSANFTLSSSSPVSWLVTARAAGVQVYESRVFNTCGNSIDVLCRAPARTMYSNGAASTLCWAVTVDFGGNKPTGAQALVTGAANFSYKGNFSGIRTLYDPITQQYQTEPSYDAKSEDISPQHLQAGA